MMKRVVDKKSSCTSVDPGQTPASPRAAASEWRRQGCGSRQGRARKSWKVLPKFRRSVLTPLHAMMACCRGVLPKLPIKRSVSLSHRGCPSFWSSQQQNTVHQNLERIQCTLINPHLITAEKRKIKAITSTSLLCSKSEPIQEKALSCFHHWCRQHNTPKQHCMYFFMPDRETKATLPERLIQSRNNLPKQHFLSNLPSIS